MLIAVLAVGKNNELGKDNQLPWHLPNDLKHFRKITDSMPMIMGRETFEALPGVLPGREHIVLTRNTDYQVDHPMVKVVHSVDDILDSLDPEKDYSVIGGKQIFQLFMPYTDKIHLTRIDEAFDADTYFDEPDPEEWVVVSEEAGILDEENTLPHRFLVLERKKK
ncbi:dihydrofolate reductase [Alkalibacter rhizosphaerae]|uniref:Dihydrofolate reductase n=1 Tax=Alkalibacter rhizosphaerae TaxID=2815577 RepID=A0A974XDF2_9FIRM|nr:dihydrofolate reductase [Alkalibacter rhizosphaerae]QSX07802.1 dihydrofolate reductase [Alkalibacter rhizosphaerae]